MTIDKKLALIAAVWFVIGGLCGFFVGKGMYDRPLDESVSRDTVTLHDTVPEYLPPPKDSVRLKWVTRRLPSKPDTITQWETLTVHDSVAVEVPISSKHYSGKNYDAYVSGFEPSLDSIFVYNETQYITERVTVSKPPNRFSIGLQGGYGYGFKSKTLEPYVGIGIGIKIF